MGKGEHSQEDQSRGDGRQGPSHAATPSCQAALPTEPGALTVQGLLPLYSTAAAMLQYQQQVPRPIKRKREWQRMLAGTDSIKIISWNDLIYRAALLLP